MDQDKLFNSNFFNKLYDEMVQGSFVETLEKAAGMVGKEFAGRANAMPMPQMTNQEQLSGSKPAQGPTFDQMWEQRGMPPVSIEDLLQRNPAQQPDFKQSPGHFGDPRQIIQGRINDSNINIGGLTPEESAIDSAHEAFQSDPTRVAMADDSMSRGKPLVEIGGGKGGGYSRGGTVPVRGATDAEVIPPSKAVAPQSKDLDWGEVLLKQGNFHPAQLRNMSPEEIQETGRKVPEGRLGPMLKPLIELGYTPQQAIKMTPVDAYRAIKGKVISPR